MSLFTTRAAGIGLLFIGVSLLALGWSLRPDTGSFEVEAPTRQIDDAVVGKEYEIQFQFTNTTGRDLKVYGVSSC